MKTYKSKICKKLNTLKCLSMILFNMNIMDQLWISQRYTARFPVLKYNWEKL